MECLRRFLIVIFTLLSFSCLGQLSCPDVLNILYNDNGTFCFFSSFGINQSGSGRLIFHLDDNKNIEVPVAFTTGGFSFGCSESEVDLCCANSGEYTFIHDENENSCWGTFLVNYEFENLPNRIFAESCEYIFLNGQTHPQDCSDELNIISDYERHYVCIGDTTHFDIFDAFGDFPPLGNFSPSDIEIQNGNLVSFTDFSFDIVWTNIGEDCLIYTTPYECQEIERVSTVVVEPKEKMQIQSDGIELDQINICIDEQISLTSSISTEAIEWITSNEIISDENIFEISFDTPGMYTIELQNKTQCNCSIPDTITVNVLSGTTPGIDCVGTICSDSEVTYYSDQECDTYLWSVSSHGTITDGGGADDYFVTVLWSSGSLGELTLSTPGCNATACRESITEYIPIIDGTAEIAGPTTACYGSYQTYSIPDFQGSDISWYVDFSDGRIKSGKFTNEVVVQWADGGSPLKTISVTYDNCNLECSGMSELDVTLVDNIYIESDKSVYCEEAIISLSNTKNQIVDWIITFPDLSTQTITNQSVLNTTLNQIGTYKIVLNDISGLSCNLRDSTVLKITPPPNIPDDILGPSSICKGELVTYRVENIGIYQNVYWQIYDGDLLTPTSSSTSKSLNYAWATDGPYQITASIEDALTGCRGEGLTIGLVDNLSLIGNETICIYNIGHYELENYNSGEIVWSIIPSTAGEIISTNENTAEIVFHEYGVHTIQAIHCNFEKTISVEIPYETFSVNWDPPCFGETAELNVTLPIGGTYKVLDSLRSIIEFSDTARVYKGEYVIQVTTSNECVLLDTIVITELDDRFFDLNISPGNYCPGDPPLTLTATNLGPGTTYRWRNKGVVFATTTIPTTQYSDSGSYFVEAIDSHGCRYLDAVIVGSCCGTSTPLPPVDKNLTKNDCFDFDFELFPPYQSTNFEWDFDDPQSGSNTATGTYVSHTFSRVGCFNVTAIGDYTEERLICGIPIEVAEESIFLVCIGAIPYFKREKKCVNESIQFTYDPIIYDMSASFAVEYDFGDPSSGASNTSTSLNPTHTYATSGDYTVTLTMTETATGCQYENTNIINIPDYPQIEITETINPCDRAPVQFEVNTTDSNLRYDWDFGDTLSPLPNTSTETNPEHLYIQDGTYTVTLTAINNGSCQTTVTKEITIITPSYSGDIISDTNYPKCPENSATLSAPSGSTYLWSTEETTENIIVNSPGTYIVTTTYSDGCTSISPPHYVYDFELGNAVIRSIKHTLEVGESTYQYDTLTVCRGEAFDLEVSNLVNVSYNWTPGSGSTQTLKYNPHFNTLPAGTYIYDVEVIHNILNCYALLDPFVVEIIDLPTQPIIVSSDTILCEENFVTLSISNPDEEVTYLWSTGQTGTEISGVSSGIYSVTATNSNGCNRESDNIIVYNNPTIRSWISGCHEVCFPDTLCMRLNTFSQYNLIKNETEVTIIPNTSTELIITEPGDYQLQYIASSGCESISEILTLDARPESHMLSGMVYLDENENGIFDGLDMLLENIPVNVYNGNTVVNDTLTDALGSYLFDSLAYSNLVAVIDPSGTGYTLSGDLNSLLLYENCLENKVIDFPLIPNCESLMRDTTFMICASSSIEIDGNLYYPNDIDTLRYPVSMNCDSVVAISVLAAPEPVVALTIDSSCVGENNGTLLINNISAADLSYSLDSDPTLFTEEMIDGLSTGLHTLSVYDTLGCVYPVAFSVPELAEAEVAITPFSSCLQQSNGYIQIDIINGNNLSFAIDGINFSNSLLIENIDIGDHTLYILDENGCESEEGFSIPATEIPVVNITTKNICFGEDEGSINIAIVNGNNLEFSLIESGPYVTDLSFDQLEVGDYILYILDENNCTHTTEFNIEEYPEISYSIIPSIVCEDEMYGSLNINEQSSGLTFSLDGVDYAEASDMDSILLGDHLLYILDENGCTDTTNFTIQSINTADVTFNITNACENLNAGSLYIDSIWIDNQFDIDGQDFGSQLLFTDLNAGDHILYMQGEEGCIREIPFTIEENLEPIIEIETNNTCQDNDDGSLEIISANTDGLNYSIDGINYDSQSKMNNIPEGSYVLHVLTPEDCLYEYPFVIESFEGVDLEISNTNTCANENNGSILIKDISNISEMYINDQLIEVTDTIQDLSEGEYSIQIIDNNGCQIQESLAIETLPELLVEVPTFDPDCAPSSLVITPDVTSSHGPIQYTWSNGSTSESVIINENGTLDLSIQDDCSEYNYSWDIKFAIDVSSDLIHVPNIFSPNGDGANDCFISTLDPRVDLISYNQLIYDRWGNLMFTSDDIDLCWDGTFHGGDVVTGVFVYITNMVVNHCDGIQDVRKIGDVTVIR